MLMQRGCCQPVKNDSTGATKLTSGTVQKLSRTAISLRRQLHYFIRNLSLPVARFGCKPEGTYGKFPYFMDFKQNLTKKLNLNVNIASGEINHVEKQLEYFRTFIGFRRLLGRKTSFGKALRTYVRFMHSKRHFARGSNFSVSSIRIELGSLIEQIRSLSHTALKKTSKQEPRTFAFPPSFDNYSFQRVESVLFVTMRALCDHAGRYHAEINRFAKQSSSKNATV